MNANDLTSRPDHRLDSLARRTAVITGGNAGLGYACAATLLASKKGVPWSVILACRNPALAQEAVERLTRVAGAPGRVETMPLDLASLASVRSFTTELTARVRSGAISSLDGLVCNAGVQSGTKRTYTADGFEMTFGVNHLGHFLLVKELLPILAPAARIAVVASGTHDPAQKAGPPAPAWNNPEALARGELGDAAAKSGPFSYGQRLYTTSKLANVYFTYGLARRLPAGVTVNAFDPGLMPGTGLLRNAPAPIAFLAAHVMPRVIPLLRLVMYPNVHTPAESGAALARLVMDPALDGSTGRYFEGMKEIRSSVESYDDNRAEELWKASEQLTASG
jgi:NAD(P)-dependent dehydrogenase (short-subunit alcohol dehydrogenase family)